MHFIDIRMQFACVGIPHGQGPYIVNVMKAYCDLAYVCTSDPLTQGASRMLGATAVNMPIWYGLAETLLVYLIRRK